MNLKKPKFWDYKKPNIVAYILTPIALLINIFLATAINQQYLLFSILGATVSIQEAEISIPEGTSGEICIVLENVTGVLERNVSVTLTTTVGTAGTQTA